MKTVGVVATLTMIFALLGTSASGEPSPKKMISLTELLPVLTSVSDYTGEFWSRSTMFGDLGGVRQDLYDKGFMLDVAMTQVVQGIVSGADVDQDWGYNGVLEYQVAFDTGKLGLWPAGLLVATGVTSWSEPLGTQIGNLSPVTYTALFPIPFDQTTELVEYYYMQGLPGNGVLNVGRINATNFVDQNRFANDWRNQFLNVSLGNNALWGYFISFSTYNASVLYELPKGFSISVAVWDPETKPGDYGGVWEHVGTFLQLESTWSVFDDLGGRATFDGVYTNKDTNALDNPFFVPGAISGNPPTKKGNWMFGMNLEQYIWKPDKTAGPSNPVRTRPFDYQEPGVGLFFRFGWTPEDRNPYNIYASGGIGGRGVIPGRPYDRMGFGVYSLIASSELNDLIIIGDRLRDEVGIEAYYNFAITPWLQISADLQWIASGVEANDDALVLGTRIFTQF